MTKKIGKIALLIISLLFYLAWIMAAFANAVEAEAYRRF
jgi:hypothetical protein